MSPRVLLHFVLAATLVFPGAAFAQQKTSGRSKYDGLTLQRGVTQDSSFNNWASDGQTGSQGSSKGTGSSKYNSITVQRGVTQDPGFTNWAGNVHAAPRVAPIHVQIATPHIKP